MSKASIREQGISSINGKKCLGKLAYSRDQLSIKGIGLQGLTNKSYAVDRITSVTSIPSTADDNLFVTMDDGSVISMRVRRGVVLVAHTLNDILGQREPAVKLPGNTTYRKAV